VPVITVGVPAEGLGLVSGISDGWVVLVAALAAATVLGILRSRVDGRLRPQGGNGTAALTAADLGAPLGERVTIVQFSSAYCQRCGPARAMLEEVAASVRGARFVEVSAEERFALVRRLNVMRTPTVLVLDRMGQIVRRGSGVPDRADMLAAVNALE
jgi:Thioredoxin domain